MAENDKNLKIGIQIGTTKTGPDAARELDNVAKSTDNVTLKTKDLRKSIAVVASEFGPLGQIASLALSGIAFGAVSVTVIVKQMVSEWRRFTEAVSNSASNLAKPIGDIKAAMAELVAEQIKADTAWKDSMESLDRDSQRRLAALQNEKKAVEEVTEARKHAELAAATSPEQKEAIENRYNQAGRAASAEFAKRRIAILSERRNQLGANLAERGKEAAENAGGLSPDQVDRLLKEIPSILTSLAEAETKANADAEELTPGYWMTLGMMGRGKAGADEMRAAMEAVSNSRATANKFKKSREFYTNLQTRLQRAQVGDQAVREGLKRYGALGEDIADAQGAMGTQLGADQSVFGIESGNDAGGQMILGAAAGADVINAGGKATAEQKRAINEASRAFGLIGLNNQQILAMLGRMNNDLASFQKALAALEKRQADGLNR